MAPEPSDPGSSLPRSILGLVAHCATGDVESSSAAVVRRAIAREGGYVCLCNVHVLTLARRDRAVREALAGAWLRLADGAPVAFVQRRLGFQSARRVGGPDLMPWVLERGVPDRLGHFLLGSTSTVLDAVERRVRSHVPGAQIIGTHSPPFADVVSIDPEAIDRIREADPHVVWCALGAPKQELWMRANAPHLPNTLLLGVGAAFEFIAGVKPRAPGWMRDSGLEWAHRLLAEPRRLGGRYTRTNSEFVARVLLEAALGNAGRYRPPGESGGLTGLRV